MKSGFKQLAMAALVVVLGGTAVSACEQYKSLSTAEMKEYRDKLVEAEADPLDRLFAFEELTCSDNPTIRAYAIREGLKAARDELVRQQIAFVAIMQKTRVDIELVADQNSTNEDKAFVKKHSGVWTLPAAYKSAKDGCVSISYDDKCDRRWALYVKGDRAELTYDKIVGEFRLSDENALVGFVRVYPDENYGRIPAVIKLF